MRYVVYGAGAIGGLVGALLAESGHDVTLIARGAHLRAMQADGLLVQTPTGERRVDVDVSADPEGARMGGRDDTVLMAVKSQDTAAALEALRRSAPVSTPIVCLQNGVANERAALRIFERVYAVCVMCPATHLEPGVIQAWSSPVTGLLDLGRYPAGVDEVAEAVALDFGRSTFESVPRPDAMRWKYAKLLLNLANAAEVVCRSPGRARVAALAGAEGRECLRVAGIDFASEEDDRHRRGNLIESKPIAGQERGGGSSWQSLTRGTGSIESDYLNGEIVMLGRLHGFPTPVNGLLQELAAEMARKGAPPGYMATEEFLARLPEGVVSG